MQAWSSYYATIGGAAATLLGLLFVAVSVNASAALGAADPLTRGMTEQAFQNYLAVLLVALLAEFPGLPASAFGWICLVTVSSRGVYVGVRLFETFRRRAPRQSFVFVLRRHVAAVAGFGMLLAAAARMALYNGADYNLLAAATLVLMFSAVTVSWELLRRIANPPT